ncbi:hypothetical protein BOTBODRAFT_234655 [Botryobasidium botryosum FD-172 SS1]|uniref:Uncharacterized protein n=1 Tax=Botryobasidium botryosum (strain FD-172 SS1) TaxID=930990 RepID=A0A067LU23_BOTB1|nr:hypothetical protein BOTBODRAFT_234655 [Botryobasidium botryosum FD-172 SS1]
MEEFFAGRPLFASPSPCSGFVPQLAIGRSGCSGFPHLKRVSLCIKTVLNNIASVRLLCSLQHRSRSGLETPLDFLYSRCRQYIVSLFGFLGSSRRAELTKGSPGYRITLYSCGGSSPFPWNEYLHVSPEHSFSIQLGTVLFARRTRKPITSKSSLSYLASKRYNEKL